MVIIGRNHLAPVMSIEAALYFHTDISDLLREWLK